MSFVTQTETTFANGGINKGSLTRLTSVNLDFFFLVFIMFTQTVIQFIIPCLSPLILCPSLSLPLPLLNRNPLAFALALPGTHSFIQSVIHTLPLLHSFINSLTRSPTLPPPLLAPYLTLTASINNISLIPAPCLLGCRRAPPGSSSVRDERCISFSGEGNRRQPTSVLR